jgi:hypothetical protein
VSLQLSSVDFYFRDRGQSILVRFCCDDHGKPETISVFLGDAPDVSHIEDNRHGAWRPCVTHAKEILRRLTAKPEKSQHAKNRAKVAREAKPNLKVWGA